MNTQAQLLPTGFQGPVRAWSSLLPVGSLLQWPRDRAALAAAAPESIACIEVAAVTESLGSIESALRRLTSQLVEGGLLLLDVDNLQSLAMLRQVVEGRPGSFDPSGNSDDPSCFLPLRRVLAAAAGAGLLVQDVIRVPTLTPEIGAELGQELLRQGLLPLDWLAGPPPSRFWLVCSKQRTLAGSVLLAGGDPQARQVTRNCLAEFLPEDWEIIEGDGVRESAQWNRAVAAAKGEVLWCLRGGARPVASTFAALAPFACVGPTAIGADGQREHSGDLCGLMLPRLEALWLGPIAEGYANTRVALEEYCMLLEAKLPALRLVAGSLVAPESPIEDAASFAGESEQLLTRYAPILRGDTPLAGKSPQPSSMACPVPPWNGREPRISLCMIARNEERFLPECLRRVRDAVDEIILVDTGSTDGTVAIAASFGAKILHTEWQDDFSAPRNLALQAATGDWILVLDADEFVHDGAAAQLHELVKDPTTAGYHLHFVNVYDEGRTLGVMMVRLFRNLPGLRYENIIHEQVTPSLQRVARPLGLLLRSCELQVDHHGYSAQVMDQRGKNERNERLFRKQLAVHPEDIYTHYKYGDFLRRVPGRSKDARQLLDRCLELILAGPPSLPRELPYAGEVAALCALEASRAGDHERARQILDIALRRFVATPNLHYLAASMALADQRSETAIAHYRRCLSYHGQVLVVPIQDGITGHVSLTGIAQAYLQRGDFPRAERLLASAIASEPAYEVAHLALSRLWLQRGDLPRALRVLTNFLASHPDSPGACQQTTLLLHRLGENAAARRMGRHAVALLEARDLDREAAAMQQILATM